MLIKVKRKAVELILDGELEHNGEDLGVTLLDFLFISDTMWIF